MLSPRKSIPAFTLIELLIVVGIIGLLATITIAVVNNGRVKSRDSKRVADLKQLQKALELSFEPSAGYPVVSGSLPLPGATARVFCNNAGVGVFQATSAGCSTIYMGIVPSNPTPGGAGYSYRSTNGNGVACTTAPCLGYCIQTTLEQGLSQGGLAAGTVIVDQSSLKNGTCP